MILRAIAGFISILLLSTGANAAIVEWGVADGGNGNLYEDWTWVTGEAFAFADWGQTAPFGNGDRISFAEMGTGLEVAWNDNLSGNSLSPQSYIAEFSDSVVPVPAALPLFLSGIAILFPLITRRRDAVRSA